MNDKSNPNQIFRSANTPQAVWASLMTYLHQVGKHLIKYDFFSKQKTHGNSDQTWTPRDIGHTILSMLHEVTYVSIIIKSTNVYLKRFWTYWTKLKLQYMRLLAYWSNNLYPSSSWDEEFGPFFSYKTILNFESPITFTIFSLSALEIGHCPSFLHTWYPFTQECIVANLVEIGQVVLQKK